MAKLTCAYTGADIVLSFMEGKRTMASAFLPRGAFDPCRRWATREAAEAALRRRPDGVHTGALVCPYTGSPISIEKAGNHYVVLGAFSPVRAYPTRADAVRLLSQRAGHLAPAPVITVSERERPRPLPASGPEAEPCDYIMGVCEKVADKSRAAKRGRVVGKPIRSQDT